MEDRIILRREEHVAWLIFNRPDRLNAMTIETWQLMGRHLASLSEHRGVRCLVLAGGGRAVFGGHRRAGLPGTEQVEGRGEPQPDPAPVALTERCTTRSV